MIWPILLRLTEFSLANMKNSFVHSSSFDFFHTAIDYFQFDSNKKIFAGFEIEEMK